MGKKKRLRKTILSKLFPPVSQMKANEGICKDYPNKTFLLAVLKIFFSLLVSQGFCNNLVDYKANQCYVIWCLSSEGNCLWIWFLYFSIKVRHFVTFVFELKFSPFLPHQLVYDRTARRARTGVASHLSWPYFTLINILHFKKKCTTGLGLGPWYIMNFLKPYKPEHSLCHRRDFASTFGVIFLAAGEI